MKTFLLAIFVSVSAYGAHAWGKTGHRVVGLIAQNHLTPNARKAVERILDNETLAEVSNFMDFIRSDSRYAHMAPWHYCTLPDGQTYEQAGTPPQGDAVVTIRRLITELKSGIFTDGDEAFALKCLVHLIGDIHQPLHVGNGEDKGGNDVKVTFFGDRVNLHRVWDSGIVDHLQYSYTEYAGWIDHVSADQEKDWQNTTVLDWVYESMQCRNQVYDLPADKRLSYDYLHKNRDLVNQRLLQAGIRLAGVLNELYG